jgi:hypothetical protein
MSDVDGQPSEDPDDPLPVDTASDEPPAKKAKQSVRRYLLPEFSVPDPGSGAFIPPGSGSGMNFSGSPIPDLRTRARKRLVLLFIPLYVQ